MDFENNVRLMQGSTILHPYKGQMSCAILALWANSIIEVTFHIKKKKNSFVKITIGNICGQAGL